MYAVKFILIQIFENIYLFHYRLVVFFLFFLMMVLLGIIERVGWQIVENIEIWYMFNNYDTSVNAAHRREEINMKWS